MEPYKIAGPILGDKVIRHALVQSLERRAIPPKRIIEELRVHNGNAIADVVTVHNDTHCYEIKGENDSIQRILTQARFYDLAFRKITLVTTVRHQKSAERLSPPHWGILVAKLDEGRVKFSYSRAATNNPHYEKKIALLTLWKSELTEVARPITNMKTAKLSRENLSNLINELLGKEDISRHISNQLAGRRV
jgi:hypothetical protein